MKWLKECSLYLLFIVASYGACIYAVTMGIIRCIRYWICHKNKTKNTEQCFWICHKLIIFSPMLLGLLPWPYTPDTKLGFICRNLFCSFYIPTSPLWHVLMYTAFIHHSEPTGSKIKKIEWRKALHIFDIFEHKHIFPSGISGDPYCWGWRKRELFIHVSLSFKKKKKRMNKHAFICAVAVIPRWQVLMNWWSKQFPMFYNLQATYSYSYHRHLTWV